MRITSLERLAPEDRGNYLPEGENISFPGPLMSSKTQKEDVMRFIQRKSQECLQHVEEPNQKEAYFFWKLMELRCNQNGNTLLAEVAVLLFKNYRLLKKLLGVNNQDSWCLPLAKLLCSDNPKDQILNDVIQMGQDLDSKGLTHAAQLCYIVAMEELQILERSSFELIGCDRLGISQSAMREAIEKTEVYEYVCWLTTGFSQPNFQSFKSYHAIRLFEFGLFDQAFEYCKTIATAIASFPQEISKTTMKLTIALSETLHQGKGKEPEWLLNLRQLYADKVFMPMTPEGSLMYSVVFNLQRPREECHDKTWEVFESQYTTGELLGKGGYGSVRAGVRKADGKQVAIKHVGKTTNDVFITIPGETHSLPLEVALMEMVSKPSRCEKVLELFEWFDTSDSYILVLERPSPCTDLRQFLNGHNCRLSETLVKQIMRQLVQAARHCNEHGVLHRDIKAENILINTETLELKLIDFGCGCLLQDTPYKCFAGTWAYCPPEWLCEELYLGVPATIWSLGVVLFDMVCGHLPFSCEDDIIDRNMRIASGLSQGCRDLILWCLHRHPYVRPTFEEILSHEWFEEPQKEVKDQLPLLESQITPWEVFESLYTPGDMLGEGGYGTVCAGYRNADGKQVAIKYVRKSPDNDFITIFGETRSLDWFEMSNCYISVLERPRPCTVVQK
ncbi:fibroblast growth factor receptor-like isoform X1 [Tachysurus fulvidraco]|uniref:fibroblast growth factor receptor-like isoform X1 n=1 Tax=Tachysurus fulvidraco TaxID=1234273 RepID=UPI001FF02560|nr:fibroblast growth factor receptor-like isoform X1 [Tachysurus fulvidraco]